jgi:putative transposase
MPRQARVVLPHFPHHVTLRGNNRRSLFSFDPDYEQFIYYLGLAVERTGVALHAAALMTNHAHLVVRPPDERALACFVKRLAQRYAQYRNKTRTGSGRLFEERYHSVPILDERQLAVTLAYVELNPDRAGVSPQARRHRWSTYANHVRAPELAFPESLWTPCSWYEELGSTDAERAARYATWVEDCRVSAERPRKVARLEAAEARLAATPHIRVRRPDESRAA